MSRKAVDRPIKNKALGQGFQGVWDYIKDNEFFTVTQVWELVDCHRETVKDYIKRLMRAGYVQQCADFETSYRYQRVKDFGNHAPQLKRDGSVSSVGAGIRNMWNSMRLLPSFTPAEIAAHSTTSDVNVSLKTAKGYCMQLQKAGYLRVLKKAVPPKQAVYKLIQNTGPKPPRIQIIKQVYDQNLEQVMPEGGAA